MTKDLKPYRFSFTAEGKRHSWVRFYRVGMEHALTDCKRVALREYEDASAFLIESDQDDEDVRKSWGLSF
jgi:hypothetical protein